MWKSTFSGLFFVDFQGALLEPTIALLGPKMAQLEVHIFGGSFWWTSKWAILGPKRAILGSQRAPWKSTKKGPKNVDFQVGYLGP